MGAEEYRQLDTITLTGCSVNGIIYPRISLEGLRRVTFVGPTDYFILERFIIPKSNGELVSNARNAINAQAVGYAMLEPSDETAIHMSTIFAMSEYSLAEVYARIDIRYWFQNVVLSIIDNTVNTTRNFVVYRVIHSYSGYEFATPYVMGIDEVTFYEEVTEEIVRNFEVISVPTISAGRGHMVRSSQFAERAIKGVPYNIYTPRYRGPIEQMVIGGSETTSTTLFDLFSSKVDEIRDSVERNRDVEQATAISFLSHITDRRA